MRNKRSFSGSCNYNHCAAIVSVAHGTILSIGGNSHRELFQGSCYGTHAEMEAIKKFCRRQNGRQKGRKNGKRIKVDIFVIRLSPSVSKLSASKPCRKCILFMRAKSNFFKVNNVWYSTRDGLMVCEKFSNLYENIDELHTTRRFRDDYDPTPWKKRE